MEPGEVQSGVSSEVLTFFALMSELSGFSSRLSSFSMMTGVEVICGGCKEDLVELKELSRGS